MDRFSQVKCHDFYGCVVALDKPFLIQGLENIFNSPTLVPITNFFHTAVSAIQKPIFQEASSFEESTNPRVFPIALDQPMNLAASSPQARAIPKAQRSQNSLTPQRIFARAHEEDEFFSKDRDSLRDRYEKRKKGLKRNAKKL